MEKLKSISFTTVDMSIEECKEFMKRFNKLLSDMDIGLYEIVERSKYF